MRAGAAALSLSQLLAPHLDGVEAGRDAGTCYVCGLATDAGYRQSPSDNFTAWAQCSAGDVICPLCRALLRDRRFRARSWLATPHSLLVRSSETQEIFFQGLVSPPPPPVAAYVTRGGQRQGYLSIMRRVSHSPGQLWVGVDWAAAPVLITAAWAERAAPLLRSLRARGLSKAALLSGPTGRHWQQAIEEGWEEDLLAISELREDPRWEVLVIACP